MTTVVASKPVSVIRPLPSLVGSFVTSSTAVKLPSALIASTTVSAVVKSGSTSIVKAMGVRLCKVTIAVLPTAELLVNTISTLSSTVVVVIRMSLLRPVGVIVTPASVAEIVALGAASPIRPVPSFATSTVSSSSPKKGWNPLNNVLPSTVWNCRSPL